MNLPPLREIQHSLCAPEGFRAAGLKSTGPDVALIVSDHPAHAAAVFTTNRVQAGEPLPFDHAATVAAMKQPDVTTTLELAEGHSSARVWTCDFSYDYVRINAEYHT